MSIEFRPAKRAQIPLLLGVAGGTGSGKTMSALLLARGIAQGQPFAFIDTENGRGLHYADLFPEMQHGAITAPFRPSKYAEAIEAADKAGFPVVVVDSASHEWYGDGGCLDWQEELMEGKESKRLQSWIEPKKAHKRMVTRLLQVHAHVILCFRAEPKVEMVDDPEKPGKKKFVAKRSLTGLDGWIPIAEKNLPYELTASFLLMADQPGVPKPIKLQEQHRSMVPLDRPLDEAVGRALAEWAAGGASEPVDASTIDPLVAELLELAHGLGKHDEVKASVERVRANSQPAAFVSWLEAQVGRAREAVAQQVGDEAEPEPVPVGADGEQIRF